MHKVNNYMSCLSDSEMGGRGGGRTRWGVSLSGQTCAGMTHVEDRRYVLCWDLGVAVGTWELGVAKAEQVTER